MEIWESFSQLLLEILELEPETIIYVHKVKSQAFETGNTVPHSGIMKSVAYHSITCVFSE